MSEQSVMSKDELLAAIDAGWDDFQSYLGSLSYEEVTIPTDAAGWTAKDHIVHLAVWEDGMNALLDKQDRVAAMGIDPETWAAHDYDRINTVIQQRYKDISLAELRPMFFGAHQRLIEKINSLSDEDLQRPYSDYQPNDPSDSPVINRIIGNTYHHYAEHTPWIGAIARKMTVMNKVDLLAAIETGWNALNNYLSTLTEQQLTTPTDAAGWTVKDHVIHLAIWEDGVNALFEGKSRQERMGIDDETWKTRDDDRINAIIQRHYQALSWSEVQHKRQQVHQALLAHLARLSKEDLQRPFRSYDPASSSERSVTAFIIGNTFGHFADHIPWIDAIVNGEQHEIQSKAEILAAVNQGWSELNNYLNTLTEQQLTTPTDAAGWTAKDHLAHLAVWEDSINALFDRKSRPEQMGIDPEMWDSHDYDRINAVIQQRYKDLPLADVRQMMRDVHQRLLAKLERLYDADLQRPYSYYQPDSTNNRPALHWIGGDTYQHYAEHTPWIDAIVKSGG